MVDAKTYRGTFCKKKKPEGVENESVEQIAFADRIIFE